MNTQVQVVEITRPNAIGGSDTERVVVAKWLEVVGSSESDIINVGLVVALSLNRTVLEIHIPEFR